MAECKLGESMGHHVSTANTAGLEILLLKQAEILRRRIEAKIPSQLRALVSAEDVLQDVWIAVLKSTSHFKMERPDSFDRWLTTVSDSKLCNAIRRAKTTKRGGTTEILREANLPDRVTSFAALWNDVNSPEITPSRVFSKRETARAVQIALSSLPLRHRSALWMRYIEGRSTAEIAKMLKKTPAAVNNLLYKGKVQLRERLGRASGFLSDTALPGYLAS